ncbi:TetR/AcrR family transcriptional regulator [Solibacillus sp. CAU 1738]|uniref:TetR/AcrR family transcriptional regulator n=1 Tax=Solibacillus sp. CAU 1738 TaxID=3140363 RepID=UPI0032600185
MARERKFSTADIFSETERLLLQLGYEGFTFKHLAERLNVSRAAIYKYYTNKEELIVDYMMEFMTGLIGEFKKIDQTSPFNEQLDTLLSIILRSKDMHQIFSMVHIIDGGDNEGVMQKLKMLDQMHVAMYVPLLNVVACGKKEGIVNENLASELVLGFIFQSIAIPNHSNIPKEQFEQSIRQMICHGVSK